MSNIVTSGYLESSARPSAAATWSVSGGAAATYRLESGEAPDTSTDTEPDSGLTSAATYAW